MSFVYTKLIINFEGFSFVIFLDYHGPLLKVMIKVCKNVFPTFLVKYFVQNETLKYGQILTIVSMTLYQSVYILTGHQV